MTNYYQLLQRIILILYNRSKNSMEYLRNILEESEARVYENRKR